MIKNIFFKNYQLRELKKFYFLKNKMCTNRFYKVLFYNAYYRLLNKCGSFIPYDCKMGNNVVFPHGIKGIFISQGAVIGDNCVIFHHVTIGSNSFKDSKKNGSPVIGKNVFIGCGAKIIGGIHIGDNCRIGAGAIVTKDVPDNSTVIMESMKIIDHEIIRDNSFIPYKK